MNPQKLTAIVLEAVKLSGIFLALWICYLLT